MKTQRLKTNLFLTLGLVATLCTLLSVPTQRARAATITVDTLVDESDGACDDGDCSLRDAIASASTGDTIDFSVSGTLNLTEGELAIGKELNIAGPGKDSLILDGGDAHRVLNVAAPTLTIADLSIAHGYVDSSGAGILISSSSVTLTNVKLSASEAAGDWPEGAGGAIYISDGSL